MADDVFSQLKGAPVPGQQAVDPANAPVAPESGNVFDTLGGNLDQQRLDRERARLAREAYDRFRGAGGRRRFMAGARNLASAVPFSSVIPGLRGFTSPEAGSEEAGDLEDYRQGQPIHSGIGTMLGRGIPYLALGAGAPGLFANLPRAMATGAAIEGGDEYAAGRGNVPGAAATGAASAIPGWLLGRITTPRSRASSTKAIADREAARVAAMEPVLDETADEMTRLLRGVTGRGERGRFVTPIDPALAMQQGNSAEALTRAATREIGSPPLTIPRISSDRNVNETLLGGALGTGIGDLMGIPHPWGTIGGAYAPTLRRMGIRGANAAIDSLNQGFGQSTTGRATREVLFRILNNQILSDADRALLHALGMPATQAGVDATGGREIPTLGGR